MRLSNPNFIAKIGSFLTGNTIREDFLILNNTTLK